MSKATREDILMRHFKNKDNLPANREGRRNAQQRKTYEPFGAYRLLTRDSQFEVGQVVNKVAFDIRKRLDREKPHHPELFIGTMALTFLQRNHVHSVMQQGGLRQGLMLGRELERIETSDLAIPFRDIDWLGAGKRKLALIIDQDTDEFNEITEVAKTVEQVLTDGVSGPRVRVKVPDHISILRFGHSRDGQPLSREHRDEFANDAWDSFDRSSVNAVTVGKLVIGEGYDKII